ncbi:glycerol-3-phosphate dehydrogenase/oxidase [Desulforhopalus singaporensis]|nr:glycerol-3-phosphate dehydrogenase/oxidase [Desulforhopalus singaporensis]
MQKEYKQLENKIFDLIIVGAGIHGAILASEASSRGYTVALLDKGDFGCATSANSLKIIHGGIRYLQHGDFPRMRQSIRSRRAMMAFAPHLVRPLKCMMPTYGHGIRGKETMRLAFGVYDLIAADRNRGLEKENRLPCSSSISAREVINTVPGINTEGLTGGAVWYDAVAGNTERLTLEYVKEAVQYGAVAVNYTRATKLETEGGRVTGVVIEDDTAGKTRLVKCRMVVNAAGPWLAEVANGKPDSQLLASAVNIVIKRSLFQGYAVGLEGYTDYTDRDALIKRGKRLFFFVPWLDRFTMIGTGYKPFHGDPNHYSISRVDIEELLADINKIYPKGDLTMADVGYYHGGLLPMTEADESASDSVQLDKSSTIVDHGATGGVSGLLSIKGVKYTTAPDIAEKVIKIISRPEFLGRRNGRNSLETGVVQPDFHPVISALGPKYPAIKEHLESNYGKGWREILGVLASEYQKDSGPLRDEVLWLVDEPKLLRAELLHFIRNEMARQLPDVVFRRSGIGSAECPAQEVLERLAAHMGEELGWNEEERQHQIAKVRRVFAPLAVPTEQQREV